MFKKIKEFLFENNTARQTVAKNTFWLSVSNFGGRAIKSAIILYAARVLGTAGYGVFSYAITLAGFLGLFMDLGINSVLTRDAAKSSDEERRTVFSTALIIKVVFLILGVALVISVGPFISTLPGATALIPVVAFIIMFDTLREFFFALLRSLEKMEWEAGIFLFTNLAIVVFGFIFIFHNPTPLSLGWGYAIGTTLGAIAAIIVIRDYFKDIFSRFSTRLAMGIVQSAWPFAVAGTLGLLLTNTDILIISWIKTASDVGIYSAAIRIVQVLYLIPAVIQVSTLPLFSRLAKKDDARFRGALERSVTMVFLLSLPLAAGGIVLGTQIMSFLFGNAFAPGGLSLKLLLVTLIVDYPGALIANAIFTYSHQKSLIITSAIGGIANVVLDVLFIPRWGMTGSAVATLIAQTLSNGYLWYVMHKINPFSIMPHLKKITAASAIMFCATLALSLLHVNLLINIGISIMIYFATLKVLREPLLAEILRTVSGGKPEPDGV